MKTIVLAAIAFIVYNIVGTEFSDLKKTAMVLGACTTGFGYFIWCIVVEKISECKPGEETHPRKVTAVTLLQLQKEEKIARYIMIFALIFSVFAANF